MRGNEVHYGKKRVRRSFSRIREVMEIPNLVEIQSDSYQWFLDRGLRELFDDISPIEDFSGNLSLEFLDYSFDEPKYTVDEAREHDANFSTPVYVKLRLINNETGEVKEQEVFFGDLPMMTTQGTFIINGAERVVVSQLVRSPGVYFSPKVEKNGREGFSAVMIPNRGAWLEFETDTRGLLNVRIDRTRKLPLSTFVRALGFGSDDEIRELISDNPAMDATLEKDAHKNPADSRVEEALKDIYESLRPGEPKTADSSRSLLNTRFFDPRRYDLAYVGRYKLNKKLDLRTRLLNQTLAETLVDPETGEIIVEEGTVINHNVMDNLAPYIDGGLLDVELNPSNEAVVNEVMEVRMVKVYSKENPDRVVNLIGNRQPEESIKWLLPEDVLASISYYFGLLEGIGSVDDIDHLGNRRIRSVGELLQNQYRIGVSRMERVVRERMSIQDADTTTPQQLINIRPVVASIKEFFGSSQLSQFMDQVNPLSELSHKRRLSALGPGGLTRERAGIEVRDVHYSHYGRMCPIETPEGPNIGLINALSTYSKINKFGFIETPYRKVDRAAGRVTDEIEYLTADEEDFYTIAQANSLLDEIGRAHV